MTLKVFWPLNLFLTPKKWFSWLFSRGFSEFFFSIFFSDCSKAIVTESWRTTTESLHDVEEITLELTEKAANATSYIETPATTPPPRLTRRKRHVNFPNNNLSDNNEYTMEVLVAVDRKMAEYHGSNINAYVLTLMSIVSNIYADVSIGNSINVAVVHIFHLKEDLHLESNHIGECFIFQIKKN